MTASKSSLLVRPSNPYANRRRSSPATSPPVSRRLARARAAAERRAAVAQRDAQLVLAREYGFAGWQELIAEVNNVSATVSGGPSTQARRSIHDNDVARLRQLLAEYPALLSWRRMRTTAGCSGWRPAPSATASTRARTALHARGMCRAPDRCRRGRRAGGMRRSHLVPRERVAGSVPPQRPASPNTQVLCRAWRLDDVRARLDKNADDLAAVNEAFMCACRLEHATVAALLLDRSIALDAELGRRIDGGPGRSAFVQYLIASDPLTFHTPIAAGPGRLLSWTGYARDPAMAT